MMNITPLQCPPELRLARCGALFLIDVLSEFSDTSAKAISSSFSYCLESVDHLACLISFGDHATINTHSLTKLATSVQAVGLHLRALAVVGPPRNAAMRVTLGGFVLALSDDHRFRLLSTVPAALRWLRRAAVELDLPAEPLGEVVELFLARRDSWL